MCRAADSCQESTPRNTVIRAELDRDGGSGSAGEGAGDGGARELLGGWSDIYLNFVKTRLSIETVEGEGDCLFIGWLQNPSLQQSIQDSRDILSLVHIAITCS